jgi:4-amino-4-deoxy-L-arabinose transferase-like glycosyltransferase
LGRLHHPLEGHSGSVFYYVPVLLVGTLPYPMLLWAVFRKIRSDLREPLQQYLFVWFAFVFVFFSFSGTKLPHYIIYGYTPLFILMALHVDRVRSDFLLLLPTLALGVCLLVLPYAIPVFLPRIKDEFARIVIDGSVHEFNWLYRLPILAGLGVIVALAVIRSIPRKAKILAVGLVVVALVNLDVIPLVARIAQEPVRQAALIAKQRNYDVYLWKLNMPRSPKVPTCFPSQ